MPILSYYRAEAKMPAWHHPINLPNQFPDSPQRFPGRLGKAEPYQYLGKGGHAGRCTK